MAQYARFAGVYDLLMQNIPYDDWLIYIQQIWQRYNAEPKLILDLACGTANMTQRLVEKGYDTIGVDLSGDMLAIAQQKLPGVLFLQQNMQNLDLFGTVDACICMCDSLNYIHDKKQLTKIFGRVNNFLNPGGIFIFDLNTKYKFESVLSGNSFSKIQDDLVCAWELDFDSDKQIMEYYTNFFIKTQNNLYERFEESHYEKCYETQDILDCIQQSGLEFIDAFDELTFNKPDKQSERIFFITKEKSK